MEVFYNAPVIKNQLRIMEKTVDGAHRGEIALSKGSVHSDIPSVHGSAPGSKRGSIHGSGSSAALSDIDDDNALEDIGRNIANLERSMQIRETIVDIESGDESRAHKLKIAGKRFFK